MGNAIWKLTCLVGIAGLGFLILVQAQQGLHERNKQAHATGQSSDSGKAGAESSFSDEESPDSPPSDASSLASKAPDHEHGHEHHDAHGESAPKAITWHTDPSAGGQSDDEADEPVTLAEKKPAGPKKEGPGLPAERPSAGKESLAAGSSGSAGGEESGYVPLLAKDDEKAAPFTRDAEPEILLADASSEAAPSKPEPSANGADEPEKANDANKAKEANQNKTDDKKVEAAPSAAAFGPNPFAASGKPPKPEGGSAAKPAPDLAPQPTPAPAGPGLSTTEPDVTDEKPPASQPGNSVPVESEMGEPESGMSQPPGDSPEAGPAESGVVGGEDKKAAPSGTKSSPAPSIPFEASPFGPPAGKDSPASPPAESPAGDLPPDPVPAGDAAGSDTLSESAPAASSVKSAKPEDPFAAISGANANGGEPSSEPAETTGGSGSATDTEVPTDPGSGGDAEAPDPFAGMKESSSEAAAEPADPLAESDSGTTDGKDPVQAPDEKTPAKTDSPAPSTVPFGSPNTAPKEGAGAEELPSDSPKNPPDENEPAAGESAEEESPFGGGGPAGAASPPGSPPKKEARPAPLGGPMNRPESDGAGGSAGPDLASPPAESGSPFGADMSTDGDLPPVEDEEGAAHEDMGPHAHDAPSSGLGGKAPEKSKSPTSPGDISAAGGAGTVVTDSPIGRHAAQLTVEKKAPARATLGEPMVYEIVVTNVGESSAKKVTVSDAVPEGARLKGTIPRAVMKGDRLTWDLGTLGADESYSIRVKVVPTNPGTIGSVATVDFVTEAPPATTDVVEPKLTLSVTAPQSVPVGKIVEFHFEIANEGRAPARNVVLRDILPSGFRHADGNDLEYDVGRLAPGAVEKVTLRAAAAEAGSFSNRAILTGSGGLKTEATATVKVVGKPLSLSRTGPQRRLLGRAAVYSNVVRNISSRRVEKATVIEEIPPGMEFVSASDGGQFNAHRRSVAWKIGPLAAGEEAKLELTLTAARKGTKESIVRIEKIDRGQGVEVASTTEVVSPEQFTSTIDGPKRPLVIGERTAFEIRLANEGAAPAEEVLVSVMLPKQLKFVEARGGESFPSTRSVTTVRAGAAIPPGGDHLIEFVVEAIAAGQANVRASIHAAQLTTPLVREADFRVVAGRS